MKAITLKLVLPEEPPDHLEETLWRRVQDLPPAFIVRGEFAVGLALQASVYLNVFPLEEVTEGA